MTDLMTYLSIPLIQNMFIATALACVLCGVIGTYVVTNRMVSVTGGIAHTTFGGVGFAYYLASVFAVTWMTPLVGALIFSIAAAVIMVACKKVADLREDTVIGALWAVGMALGVVFMCYMDRSVLVPSSYESILFGNMLLIDRTKLICIAAITAVVLVVVAVLFHDLRILTFDRTFAQTSGIRVTVLDLVLHVLISISCVVVANVVGIIMIIALMTIPAAMGNMVSRNLGGTMLVGTVLGIGLSVLSLIMSLMMDTPPGATVVIVLGIAFILMVSVKHVYERSAS